MYNVDDAVARGGLLHRQRHGGGRSVGDRRLVRIESVERSAAPRPLVMGAG